MTHVLQIRHSASTAPTRYVDILGDTIAYRVIGEGSPLLLLNRMRGTLDTWDPLFLDHLAAKHRVVTVDYRGTGYSAGTLPTDMSEVANFIAEFANAIGLRRFALLGWSWGGLVSQTLVVEHPQLITHAILVGTSPPGPGQAEIQDVWRERALKAVNDLDDEVILFFEPKSKDSREAAKASRARIYARPNVAAKIPSTMEEFQEFFQGHIGFREDRRDRRAKLKVSGIPMLIICGDNDTSVPASNWYPLVGAIPKAQLIVLPQSGHGPQHQYPVLSADYINAFIDCT